MQDKNHRPQRRTVRAIISGSMANLVIWYDWYVYAAFGIYFSAAFFPESSPTVQLLKTAGIFALGFLMRPVGGWILGGLGDRFGRRRSMLLSVVLMSLGSLIIALTPSYHIIGVYAPALLLFARLLQGFSIGGETGISTAYLCEMAPPHRRGFYSSFQYATLVGGQICALGTLIVLQRFWLSEQQLLEWGWRIPFVIGAFLTLITFYLHHHLHETKAYLEVRSKSIVEKGIWKRLKEHPKAIFWVVGVTMGGTLAFYTYITYMQKYLVNTIGMSKADATLITFFALLFFALIQPLLGGFSDRIGRKPLLIAFGVSGTLCTLPLISAMDHAGSGYQVFGILALCLIILSGYTSISAAVKAELFPAEVRAVGVGLPHALTVALFGGSTEYIALWLKNKDMERWFFWYVTMAIFISLLLFINMKDTQKHNKIDGEPHG